MSLQDRAWNLPNALTLLRIFLVPLLVVVLLTRFEGHVYFGAAIFGLAVATDYLDGYFARRRNEVTRLGILLDPLADKLLLVLGLVILTLDNTPRLDRIPLWLTATVLARDVMLLLFLVLVNYLVGQGTVHPHFTGKIATVLQMGCVVWALLKWDPDRLHWLAVGATAFTAVSGLIYLRDGILMISAKPPSPANPT